MSRVLSTEQARASIDRGAQRLTFVGDAVFQAAGPVLNRALHQNAFIDQLRKPVRENITRNTKAVLKIVETRGPLQGCPHDQKAPPIADLLNCGVHPAVVDVHKLVHGHSPSTQLSHIRSGLITPGVENSFPADAKFSS